MTKQQAKKGFTIIEVVLVLAIAGLIFLMVFLALPALQRSQRDTQRRDDMARFAAQIQQYQANNRGKVPNNTADGSKTTTVSVAKKAVDSYGGTIPYPNTAAGTGTLNGSTDGLWSNFLENYMWAANDDFTDPGGTPYGVIDHGKAQKGATDNLDSGAPTKDLDYVIHVWHGAICGTEEGKIAVSTSGSTRKLAFVYKLEGAGYYCGEV